MSETQASIGYGITFEMADVATPTTFDYVSEIYNLELGSEETDQIDASHMQSPDKMREYIDGLTDPGQTSFEMNYIPGSASDLLMIAARGLRKWCRVTFPNGIQVLFRGSRQSYSVSNPHDAKQTASVTFQRSGRPIQTEPTAPRSLVAGLIVGTAKVGVPLTLDVGAWAGATSFAIQWQKDDAGSGAFADISGATTLAYVPVAGDVGNDIRVAITASNADFETVFNTTETAAVIA